MAPNARDQRPGAEVAAHNRCSEFWHDTAACALCRTRSRCRDLSDGRLLRVSDFHIARLVNDDGLASVAPPEYEA
jgi:hypothetical protein